MSCSINTLKKFKNGWSSGLPETVCGVGSTMKATKQQREWITNMLETYNITTVSDIGAGDLNWIRSVLFHDDVQYSAFDIVPRHKSVSLFDIRVSVPPSSDLLMCLWVLNHMDTSDQDKALHNLSYSMSSMLMITQKNESTNYNYSILDTLYFNNGTHKIVLYDLLC